MGTSRNIKAGSNRRLEALTDVFVNPNKYRTGNELRMEYSISRAFTKASIELGYIKREKRGLQWGSEAVEPSLELVNKIRFREREITEVYKQDRTALAQKSDLFTPKEVVTPQPTPKTVSVDEIINIAGDLIEQGLTGNNLKVAVRYIVNRAR